MKVFVTGATGLLGSAVIANLLDEGCRPAALVRSRGDVSARERMWRIVSTLRPSTAKSDLDVIPFESGAKLEEQLRSRGPFDAAIHSAASVKFDASPESIHAANVTATEELVSALDSASPATHLHFVSTAYVHKRTTARAREEAVSHTGWTAAENNSPYEASKRTAEEIVAARSSASGRPYAIHRPSIIAGDSRTGAAASFAGISVLLRALASLSRTSPERLPAPPAIICDSAATKNIVPVDWVARALVALVLERARGVFHLTHPNPPTHRELLDRALEATGALRVGILPRRELATPSAAQRALDRALGAFETYLFGEPSFDRSRLEAVLGEGAEPPPIDTGYLRRLTTFGESVRWRERPLETPMVSPRGLSCAP